MDNIRVVFTKTDRARFISHLDLLRCMQRAIKRAGLPIQYTNGFNPRSYIMFPLALSLGLSSQCEIMDFTLTECVSFDEVKMRMNNALPDGLKVVSVSTQNKKHTEIAFAQYDAKISSNMPVSELLLNFNNFLSMDKIEIEKFSKKKVLTNIDIKPDIQIINTLSDDDTLVVTLKLPAGTQSNLNANLVFEAFEKCMNVDIKNISIERTKILCLDGEDFS